jgi:hypothetical protein
MLRHSKTRCIQYTPRQANVITSLIERLNQLAQKSFMSAYGETFDVFKNEGARVQVGNQFHKILYETISGIV